MALIPNGNDLYVFCIIFSIGNTSDEDLVAAKLWPEEEGIYVEYRLAIYSFRVINPPKLNFAGNASIYWISRT